MSRVVWTFDEAHQVIRLLKNDLWVAGWGVALGGSVLHRKSSFTDLDLVLFPLNSRRRDVEGAKIVLKHWGMRCEYDEAFVKERWKEQGSDDEKHVEVWMFNAPHPFQGRRIDIFFLKG